MSAADKLLRQLARLGATVEPAGGHLILRAGATSVPAGMVARLRKAKAEVLETLVPTTSAPIASANWRAHDWHRLYSEKLRYWAAPRRDTQGSNTAYAINEARELAWGEVVAIWHKHHGARPNIGICAGCGELVGEPGINALLLADGTRVHLHGDLHCLTTYGSQWRRAATRALVALGLEPPAGIAESMVAQPNSPARTP